MFDGPFYEYDGPSSDYVREDLKKKYKKGYHAKNDYYKYIYVEDLYNSHKIIDRIIDEKILDNTNFGSWRGYATFGIENAIINILNKYINRQIAINILSKHLKSYLIHYLYKPGGMRTHELKKDFELKCKS